MSKLLLNTRPHIVLPELAASIGLNEAVMLQQLYFIQTNSREHHLFDHEGRTWVSMSQEEMLAEFPYFSESTLRRTIRSVEAIGVLRYEIVNENPWNRTKSYTVMADRIEPVKLTGCHPVKLTGSSIYKEYKEENTAASGQPPSDPPVEPFQFKPEKRHIIAYSDDWNREIHAPLLDPILHAMGWYDLVEAGEESWIPKAQRLAVLAHNLGYKTKDDIEEMIRHFQEKDDWRFRGKPTPGNMQVAFAEWKEKKPDSGPEVGDPETVDWMSEDG